MSDDAMTIARCAVGRRATKRIVLSADGLPQIEGYDAGKYISAISVSIASTAGLRSILDQVARNPRDFILRGELLPDANAARCRRLLYPHHEDDGSVTLPTFREVPRRWAILDFDNVPKRPDIDPSNGAGAAAHCRSLLPEAWASAACWWGLSSSAGFKPGIRIKLGFWLARAVLGGEVERHLKGCPIDASTLRAVQPIYIARPILVGVADPIRQRSGALVDGEDAVDLPELPPVQQRPAASHAVDGRRYVSGDDAGRAERRLAGLCDAVERARIGERHRCLIWAAATAVELDDAIPRADIAAELIAAAQRAGLEDHEADLARQVRNGFRLGIFGSAGAA
ncbi:MAG: hypothetical protein U1E17_24870 [Geminicoccaceae bacterium]